MHSYTDFSYSGDEDSKLWSSFIQQSSSGPFDDFQTPLYSSIFPATTSPHLFAVPEPSTLPHQQIVVDYNRRNSQDFAPFQDLIDRRNWCLSNLRLSTKEAEALRQENVNLQRANSELNKQLSHLQLQAASASVSASASAVSSLQNYANATMFPSVNSIVNRLGRMKIGEKGPMVIDKRVARGVENVDPVKKTEVERVKLPKSISVRSNGYLKTIQADDGSASRSRAVDRVKPASDMQRVYVRGKEEEEPVELKVYNQGMTKTELCNKWQQTGACPYGDHCQFAHGIEELRPVIRHPRYKTEVCRMVLAGDPCPYGHRCHFRHALTEEEKFLSRG
ncbi:putative transcription factor C3H family [Helianthus annuus]|nr:putative transcription factor C3H family [Helianthus annuus]